MKSILFTAATLVSSVCAISVMEKIMGAKTALTQVARINALEDSDFVFDFLHPASGITTGGSGHTVGASASNFPGIIGNGMAMTIGFLNACGFNTPHTHPRATEFNFAVNGTLIAGMLAENGARFVLNEVPAGSAAIFPKGAIHFEMNNGCEPMIFVAAFNDEDPGVLQVAQRFFGIKPEFVAASLGATGAVQVAGLEALIPDNVSQGVDECLKRCGITRITQPTAQRQQRIATNALPKGFSGPPPPPPAPSMSMSMSSPGASGAPMPSQYSPAPANKGALDNSSAAAAPAYNLTHQPAFIAMIVIVALMVVGYVGLAVAVFQRSGKNSNKGWKILAGREVQPRGGMEDKPFTAPDYGMDNDRYDPYPVGDHKQ